jgi:hypothetical protein
VIALAVAFGLAAHSRRAARVLSAVPIPILAATAYFTYSRGAAIAFGLSLAVTFALDQRRIDWLLRTATIGVLAGLGVFVASRLHALTTQGAKLESVTHEGRQFAVLLVVLCAGSALAAFVPRGSFTIPIRLQRPATLLVTAVGLLAIVASLVSVGGPQGVWDKFGAAPPSVRGDLNQRLFTFSGNGRTPIWTQALHEYRAHPILGGGAGSYETYYLQHRTRADKVRNAHNVYLETLAEVGPLGLVLLLIALLSPLALTRRAREHRLVPALAGAYVAFLIHMTVDWDWQLTAVAVTGLFCGAGVLVAARGDQQPPITARARRIVLALTVVAIAVSFIVLVGNLQLSRASNAASAGDWIASARDAKHAHGWAPWSSEPYRLLGEAQLGEGNAKAAAASFRRAIDKSPKDWNLWFDLARATLGSQQRAALNHAAKLNPLSPEVAEFRRELAEDNTITVAPNQP